MTDDAAHRNVGAGPTTARSTCSSTHRGDGGSGPRAFVLTPPTRKRRLRIAEEIFYLFEPVATHVGVRAFLGYAYWQLFTAAAVIRWCGCRSGATPALLGATTSREPTALRRFFEGRSATAPGEPGAVEPHRS